MLDVFDNTLKTLALPHLSAKSANEFRDYFAAKMVAPKNSRKKWTHAANAVMNRPKSHNYQIKNTSKILPRSSSRVDKNNRNGLTLDSRDVTFEKTGHGRISSKGSYTTWMNFNEKDDRKTTANGERQKRNTINLGFPTIVKAKSAENVRTMEDFSMKAFEKENRSRMNYFERAGISPILKRRGNSSKIEKPILPMIQLLKQQDRRRSKSLEELSFGQKLRLQQILKENHPSYAIDNAFWSQHWLETRNQLLLKEAKRNVACESKDCKKTAETSEDKQSSEGEDEDVKSDRLEMKSRTGSISSELSLEDRLLLIERMHGLKHDIFS